MIQICPKCKETSPNEATVCLDCGKKLTTETICPFCKGPVSGMDIMCPHCEKLLIYEQPKKVTAKRNSVLFPLGFLLLFAAALYWRFNSAFSTAMHWVFILVWLLGFTLFGAYMGKGDRDFWFGK